MAKSYRHISLPKSLISKEILYIPPPKRNISDPFIFNPEQKKVLLGEIKNVSAFYTEKSKSLKIENDDSDKELKIKFEGAPVNKGMIRKYGITVYRKEKRDDQSIETIYGKVSDKKLPQQNKSDFQRLVDDIEVYNSSPKDKFKSLFKEIKEIKPLTLEEITQEDLLKEFQSRPDQESVVDISFASRTGDLNKKMLMLEKEFGERFLSKLNSELVHFCRIKVSGEEVRKIAQSYSGITYIEHGPRYRIKPSSISKGLDRVDILPPVADATPVIVLDTPVNIEHLTIKGAVVYPVTQLDQPNYHGTAVASLVISGLGLSAKKSIQRNNRVICINIFRDISNLEANIQSYVEKYAKEYGLLLINLSFNEIEVYAKDSHYSKLTILLDELAYKFNCIFFISAGNLFDWEEGQKYLEDECKSVGYPAYFKLPFTRIQQPANSINNVSVGSVAYQISAVSLANIKHPSPHARGNIDGSPFIKPDLVNYDSNYNKDYVVEDNGPNCASLENESLTQMVGTSFATPLVVHDAALIHREYPKYNNNTLKALLIHFADKIKTDEIPVDILDRMVGFGMPNIEKTRQSFNHSSTIVIEDFIGLNKTKTIKFPIPSCISGSQKKRLRIRKTLVYNPQVNPSNITSYNPINLSAKFHRKDQKNIDGTTTARAKDGAHRKSNVKKYPWKDFSTKKNTGEFWFLDVSSEVLDEDALPSDYVQKFSLVLTLEDLNPSNETDLHSEIMNMIDIETHIESTIEVNDIRSTEVNTHTHE